ncbi:HEPN domain-containing protein [Candidatus Woesearchaeota archaeon]|nr:HEPN domain-containing protein [Candidatus Woesearchaeota archaeon]
MQTRYPDVKGFRNINEFSFDECEQVVKEAEEILRWIEKEL